MAYGDGLRWLQGAAASDTDECLLWPFGRQRYAQLRLGGKVRSGTEVVLELVGRPRPGPGVENRHLCGRGRCCNPRHLRWGTHAENEADKVAHGTAGRGTNHHRAKLTDEAVVAVRASSEPLAVLAARYGVGYSTIKHARRGATWKHLPLA